MKKISFKLLAAMLPALFLLAACRGDEDPETIAPGAYVLNNGSWGDNNSGISIYDLATGKLTSDAFQTVNGAPLGDLGQDILHFGKELYIAVNGSRLIFVTDLDLKIKKTITASEGGAALSPRSLCSGGGKVYVTYYEGYLGEIDPATYEVRTTPVGPNPEGLGWCDGKLYVANSGGYLYPAYNNTVSVVDAASFKETSTITVNTNPNQVAVWGDKVYVSSFGDYAAVAPKIQYIETSTAKVSDLNCSSPSAMALRAGSLFVLCGGYDESWNPLPGKVLKFDAASVAPAGEFVTDGTTLPEAYSISVTAGRLWVGCSDYKTSGKVYMFDVSTGKLLDSFNSGGMNPLKVAE